MSLSEDLLMEYERRTGKKPAECMWNLPVDVLYEIMTEPQYEVREEQDEQNQD